MLTRSAIFVHRWLGVALCVVFLIWFPSGIGIMYWDYPGVSTGDRLERSPALDASKVRLSAEEAYAQDCRRALCRRRSGSTHSTAAPFTGSARKRIVYADTGDAQIDVSPELMLRVASAWTGQPANAARIEAVEEVDQWTVGGVFRSGRCGSTRGRTASRCTSRNNPERSCSTRRPARGSAPTWAPFRIGSTSRRCASTGWSGAGS